MQTNKKEKTVFQQLMVYVSKLFSTAIIVILVLIGLFLLFYFITAKVQESKGEEFNPKFTLYTILSGSMEPIIKVYDVIFTVRVDDLSTIKVGDVITFISSSYISDGMTVTHRVLEVRKVDGKYEFVTKGDNNATADSATAKGDDVIGKVLFKIPQLGLLQSFVGSKMGWVIVVLLPALGIIIYDIIKLFRILGVKRVSDNLSSVGENGNTAQVKEENKKIDAIFENIIKSSNGYIEESQKGKEPDEDTSTKELPAPEENKLLDSEFEETKKLKAPLIESDSCTCNHDDHHDCNCQHQDCQCNKESNVDNEEDYDFAPRKDLVDTLRDLKVLTTSLIKKEEDKEETEFFTHEFKFFEEEKDEPKDSKFAEETKHQIEDIISKYRNDKNESQKSSDNTQRPNDNRNNNQNQNNNQKHKKNKNQNYNQNKNNQHNKNNPNKNNKQYNKNQNKNNQQFKQNQNNSNPKSR